MKDELEKGAEVAGRQEDADMKRLQVLCRQTSQREAELMAMRARGEVELPQLRARSPIHLIPRRERSNRRHDAQVRRGDRILSRAWIVHEICVATAFRLPIKTIFVPS